MLLSEVAKYQTWNWSWSASKRPRLYRAEILVCSCNLGSLRPVVSMSTHCRYIRAASSFSPRIPCTIPRFRYATETVKFALKHHRKKASVCDVSQLQDLIYETTQHFLPKELSCGFRLLTRWRMEFFTKNSCLAWRYHAFLLSSQQEKPHSQSRETFAPISKLVKVFQETK